MVGASNMSGHLDLEPARTDVDAMEGPVVVEFGTSWCGICRAAQPAIERALASHPAVRHLKVEDGPGRPLGRSFRVKLWPTLVYLENGVEKGRVVRPESAAAVEAIFGSGA
jgi:thioredoxin 1